jgi:hypothetical protein
MELEGILFCAGGAWVLVVLMCVSLCRAAKASDEAFGRAYEAAAAESAAETEPMSSRRLSIEQAACVLGISPRTLLAWEERYGYPRSAEGHLLYRESDVIALREALEHGLSVSSAVSSARATSRRRRASA